MRQLNIVMLTIEKIMKHVSILPLFDATLASIDSSFQLFSRLNDFMRYQGRQLFYNVDIVGLKRNTALGFYHITSDKMIAQVQQTDVIVLPLLCGDFKKAIREN